MIPQTLCLFKKDGRLLLGMKKRRMGTGKWNGFGGKLLDGETLETSLIRELDEEISVKVAEADLNKIGNLKFFFKNGDSFHVHIYFADKWEGEPKESEEMATPTWFDIDKLPFDQMWSDDKHWMPVALAGKKFEGEFYFDDAGKDFDKFEIREI